MKRMTVLGFVCLALTVCASTVFAGPVVVGGPWYEFKFGGPGTWAVDGSGTVPSSGGNSVFADSPPWTFSAGASGAILTVTDAFANGDAFEIFDFGSSIGSTPLVAATGNSGSDPAISVLDPAASHASFNLGAGAHEITIQAIASPFGSGAAYFRVDGANVVPVPGAFALAMMGVGLVSKFRKK